MRKLTNGFKITKTDNIIAGILFIIAVALPAFTQMENWMIFTMYVVFGTVVVTCCRLSYLRSK